MFPDFEIPLSKGIYQPILFIYYSKPDLTGDTVASGSLHVSTICKG